MASLSCRA
jgi:hypothetical protein